MQSIDRSKPVLVTGATGYVAGWLVKKLLNEAPTQDVMYDVRALFNSQTSAIRHEVATQLQE